MKISFLNALAGFIAFSVTLSVVLVVGGFYWFSQQYVQAGPLAQPQNFIIERGQNAGEIAANLQDIEAVSSAQIFELATRVMGRDNTMKAGEYEIPAGASMKQIARLLSVGKTVQRFITIPEGRTSYEIVQQLRAHPELQGDITDIPVEGALLPDTYDYQKGMSRKVVLQRMKAATLTLMEQHCALQDKYPPSIMDFSDHACRLDNTDVLPSPLKTIGEVITLASIVEKETGVAEERRYVAGLFLNRLRKGMLLQTDPTVIYAMTKGRPEQDGQGPIGRRLLRKDLKIDSPYNTYLYPGLPPGPICNPGAASIQAVLNPIEHQDLYMVADGTGGHAFASSLKAHNANVAKWRKIRAQK